MMLLGTKDESMIAHLDGTIGNKYTHLDIQNEFLYIIPRHVLLSKLETIRKNVFFFKMASSVQQFSLCIRTADNTSKVKQNFLGFYE